MIGLGHLGALAGAPDARRAARLPDLPDPALQPGPRAEPAGQHDPRRLGRGRADHRDARRAAVGGRAPGAGRPRARAGPARARPRHLPLSRDRADARLAASRSRSSRARCSRWSAPSGAGKSTLAKLLLRFYDPHFGADRARRQRPARADAGLGCATTSRCCCRRPSSSTGRSARTSPTAGRARPREQVEAAALAADAHEFICALPEGYDTEIGQKGRRLSGGQRQRIAIARAMVRDAPVLILDEPTTGLDAESSERVLEPLRRLMGGRTTIVISHNLVTRPRRRLGSPCSTPGAWSSAARTTSCWRRGGRYARLWQLGRRAAAARPRQRHERSTGVTSSATRCSHLRRIETWTSTTPGARNATAAACQDAAPGVARRRAARAAAARRGAAAARR